MGEQRNKGMKGMKGTNGNIKSTKPKNPKKTLLLKQKLFCKEYIVDYNAPKAAIRAGYATTAARSTGFLILARESAQAYIRELLRDRERRMASTVDRWVVELDRLAYFNLADIKKEAEEADSLGDLIHRIGRDQAAVIKSIEEKTWEDKQQGKRGKYKLTFHSKTKALDMLGKYHGATTRQDLNIHTKEDVKVKISIDDLNLSVEDRRRILNAHRRLQVTENEGDN